MENDPREIWPGAYVRVYNDRTGAFEPATVLCRYGYKSIWWGDVCWDDYGVQHGEPAVWLYPDMLDVRFELSGRVSKGHFTDGVEIIH